MAKPACIMLRTGGREAGDPTAHPALTLLQGRASELSGYRGMGKGVLERRKRT